MRLCLVISLVLATAAFAAEQAAPARPPASAPASEGGLDAARRDFETVKSLRNGTATQQKGALPQLSVPTLDLGSGAEPGSRSPSNQKKAKDSQKKSANWLVEAMNKEKQEAGKDRASDHERELEELMRPDAKMRLDAGEIDPIAKALEQQKEGEKEKPLERRPPVSAPNPLNPFLADWMTPQDFALLQPARTELSGATVAASTGPVSAPVDRGFTANPAVEAGLGLGGDNKPVFTSPAARENPYLQPLTLPAPPPATVFTPPVNPAPSSPAQASGIFAPSAPPPSAPAKLPDFVRPLPDEKHFKQLKRF